MPIECLRLQFLLNLLTSLSAYMASACSLYSLIMRQAFKINTLTSWASFRLLLAVISWVIWGSLTVGTGPGMLKAEAEHTTQSVRWGDSFSGWGCSCKLNVSTSRWLKVAGGHPQIEVADWHMARTQTHTQEHVVGHKPEYRLTHGGVCYFRIKALIP